MVTNGDSDRGFLPRGPSFWDKGPLLFACEPVIIAKRFVALVRFGANLKE
jgi:hypothetical protein